MKARASLLAVPSLLLIAACGSAASPVAKQAQAPARPDARQAVLASLEKTTGSSFLADMTVSATVAATGPKASLLGSLQGKAITGALHLSAENQHRMRMTIDAQVAGKSTTAIAVVYDNTVYISSDGGATFRTESISGAASDQFASSNTLSYLQSIGNVTDEGPGTADGVAVERYSAQLDAAKVLKLIQAELGAAQAASAQRLFKSVTYNGGALEVTVDHQGHIVTEHGPINASVDLGALEASFAGTRLNIHEDIDGHFHDYGSAVTVTRPAGTASN